MTCTHASTAPRARERRATTPPSPTDPTVWDARERLPLACLLPIARDASGAAPPTGVVGLACRCGMQLGWARIARAGEAVAPEVATTGTSGTLAVPLPLVAMLDAGWSLGSRGVWRRATHPNGRPTQVAGRPVPIGTPARVACWSCGAHSLVRDGLPSLELSEAASAPPATPVPPAPAPSVRRPLSLRIRKALARHGVIFD